MWKRWAFDSEIIKVAPWLFVRVPTWTGKSGKPGKMGRHFPVREKSRNFEQTGKVRENHTKYWKMEINWDKYYLIFLVIFKWTVHYLLKLIKFSVKKNKTLKKYWKNGKKYWKSQGILSVQKSGNPVCSLPNNEKNANYLLSLRIANEVAGRWFFNSVCLRWFFNSVCLSVFMSVHNDPFPPPRTYSNLFNLDLAVQGPAPLPGYVQTCSFGPYHTEISTPPGMDGKWVVCLRLKGLLLVSGLCL